MATLKRFTVLNRSLRSNAPAQYSIGALVSGNNKITKIVDNPFPLNSVTTKTTRTNYGIGGNPFVGSYKTPGLQAEISMQIIKQPAAEISIQVFRNQSSNTRIIRPGR
jgi:hypothetical protein